MNPSIPCTTHLILGGARSGKSSYAERMVESLDPPYVYIATARAFDLEMEERIHSHRRRRGPHWTTLECPFELPQALERLQETAPMPVLLDCMTLWLTNLLLMDSPSPPESILDELLQVISRVTYPLYVVSNEVGGGIVPDNALARRFRDLAGTANQKLAAACERVTLVVAGIPLTLK